MRYGKIIFCFDISLFFSASNEPSFKLIGKQKVVTMLMHSGIWAMGLKAEIASFRDVSTHNW